MSIVALKRKTAAKYNNSSVGQKQFSLNGVHRSQGYVGQTMLSRRLPKTPMVGNTPKGCGGCCGTYLVKPIVQSGVNYQEDARTIKTSVLSAEGMIRTKYRWITRPQPYAVVKPDSNHNFHTQQDYIEKLRDQTVGSYNVSQNLLQKINGVPIGKTLNCNSNACSSLGMFTKSFVDDMRSNPLIALTKPETNYTSDTQGNYILSLRSDCNLACVDKYNDPTIRTTMNHFPVGCGISS